MRAFLSRRTGDVPTPREWMLEVTNRCNLACPMCLRDKVKFVQRDMDIRFIRRLLETDHPPDAVWPYGFGEPMMYPYLMEAVRLAKQNRIAVSLSTNATLLSEKAGSDLLDSGMDYLIVAFDGATPETYARYRKGADFHRVKANVERFLDMKLARRSRLHLTLQMILMDGTDKEAAAFRRLWTRKGVDCVRVRDDLTKSPSRCGRITGVPHRPCFFLWRGPLFVQASGAMVPCPYYHGAEPFADLTSQTVREAWNSPKMVQLRRAHLSGDLTGFPLCARCPRYQPHRFVSAAGFFIGTRGIRQYMPFAERAQLRIGRRFFQ
jgi:MoaA/NifB/PqqE/SkfB family radical SAM enzyme